MNKKEPKSFILYCNFENQFKLLSLEERGILISAIFEYARERKFECELPPLVNMAFSLIKDTMDRDYEEYMERCEINAINGRKGGRPRKIEESDVPTFTPKPNAFLKNRKKPIMIMRIIMGIIMKIKMISIMVVVMVMVMVMIMIMIMIITKMGRSASRYTRLA